MLKKVKTCQIKIVLEQNKTGNYYSARYQYHCYSRCILKTQYHEALEKHTLRFAEWQQSSNRVHTSHIYCIPIPHPGHHGQILQVWSTQRGKAIMGWRDAISRRFLVHQITQWRLSEGNLLNVLFVYYYNLIVLSAFSKKFQGLLAKENHLFPRNLTSNKSRAATQQYQA